MTAGARGPRGSNAVRLAVVGVGSWGRNYVRSLAADTAWICDPDPAARALALRLCPTAMEAATLDPILADPTVGAVIIAAPAPEHARLARACLGAGKHVLVEKPMAMAVDEARALVALAEQRGRVLAVGHLMVYHPVVRRLAELVAAGELGRLLYLDSTRVNLGRLRRDENALWSFGPHDLSMIDLLLAEAPVSVAARGQAFLQPGIADVVFVTLRFGSGVMAHLHLSWLSPRKERRLTLVGASKMAEFDDVAVDKLRIFDRGYDRPPGFTEFAEYLTLRDGAIHVPHVPMAEPLRLMLDDFLACVRAADAAPGQPAPRPLADGAAGLRVVRILDAAQRSLDADGVPKSLDPG